MTERSSTFSQVRKIDNSRQWLPFITTLLLIFLIILFIWFFRGGSFKLYASLFFSIYFVTHQIWISVILMGILQNIIFIPLRMIGNIMRRPLDDFESGLDKVTTDFKQQRLIFSGKVKEGNLAIIFYIFNFFVNAIAFFSAGRIFLIDFYTDPLKLQKMNLLYKWVPYPNYPLVGTDFKLPLFKITETTAVSWPIIFWIIIGVILFFSSLRLLWRLFRFFLKKNKKILYARIQYNRLLFKIGGFAGAGILLTMFILRHIPTTFEMFIFIADLTRQNTPMNFTTAVGTFITTIHAGYKNNSLAANQARLAGVSPEIVSKVLRDKMRISLKNGLILGAGAFFITNHIPSAFELSVSTFEVMYIIYPYTFGRIVNVNTRHIKNFNASVDNETKS